jgi:hypothetical protein
MEIQTLARRWQRARTINATDNGFPSIVPTGTMPSGIGDNAAQASAAAVEDLLVSVADGVGPNVAKFVFFGVGADNTTFSVRTYGWTYLFTGNPDTALWIPVLLFEVAVTLSAVTGVAGLAIDNTNRFADTISLTIGNTADVVVTSPANDTVAHLVADVKGFQLLQHTFTTGASATSCNSLNSKY